MSREANMKGRIAVQPDKDTLLLLLRVASSKESLKVQNIHGWESALLLVDTIRHGRLPAVMSTDQWELPDLNVQLDQAIWKAMFECIYTAGSAGKSQALQSELDTATFLMAEQLSCSHEVDMDDALWGYVVKAFGDNNAGAKLKEILPALPAISTSPELYAKVAEALANTGSSQFAANIIDTLYATHKTVASIDPIVALGRHYARTGDYETLRRDFHIWQDKGTHTNLSKSLEPELHRNFMSASAVALGRIIDTSSKTFKERESDILPENVLPGLTTPPQLSTSEYKEARYLYDRSYDAWSYIPLSERTLKDHEVMLQILCRLNLIKPTEWPIESFAGKLLSDMKKYNVKLSKACYMTVMETLARTREFGVQREDGKALDEVMKVYNDMVKSGYQPTSAQDFTPLLEACCSLYSSSAFAAGLWMYSNQHFGVNSAGLNKVEDLMRQTLGQKKDKEESSGGQVTENSGFGQGFHNSTSLAVVLAGLARADKVEELYKRWNALPFEGIERDAALYQTMIGASQGQEKLARHTLQNIRYEMLKEQPPVRMTPEIYSGLLNCCVRIQDATTARTLINQYSGEIKKTSEWYMPMVRACLMIDGLEQEGEFLLEEMKKKEMKMSPGFHEFLMEYFVTKRGDYAVGREIFKSFVRHDQHELDALIDAKKKGVDPFSQHKAVLVSDKELARRAERLRKPVVENLVDRIELSQKSAAMLNLLAMSHLRERAQMLETEKQSGFSVGSAERLKNARIVIHYLVGDNRKASSNATGGCGCASKSLTMPTSSPCSSAGSSSSTSSVSSPSPSSSASSSSSSSPSPAEATTTTTSPVKQPTKILSTKTRPERRLLFVNKYVLGEYIDNCIKDGSPAMLEEADWALNSVMPRVITDEVKYAKDSQRLRQALESARSRQDRQGQDDGIRI
ncbi:hypothetical protein BGZ94_003824 [Podila epigama]|nr:hypothetical protein BGZ94_003824 [Podila epigama]